MHINNIFKTYSRKELSYYLDYKLFLRFLLINLNRIVNKIILYIKYSYEIYFWF